MQWAKKENGFTIVELLIVIVVIAILAAITMVAFNGVQNRARASASQSAAAQTQKKILAYAVDNSDQLPATLAAISVANTTETTYQYSVNNSTIPRTFCVTVTTGTQSYYVSDSQPTPTSGACSGHIAGGGPITNLVQNPAFYTATTGAVANTGASQTSTNTRETSGGPTGGAFYRRTYTAASGALSSTDIIRLGLLAWAGGSASGVATASPGQVFTASGYIRSSKAQALRLQLQWLTAAGASTGTTDGTTATLTPNTWTRVSVSGTAPASTGAVRLDLDSGTGATPWANGDTVDFTMTMLTEGSDLYNYADGYSASWNWNGTAGNSTSTGTLL